MHKFSFIFILSLIQLFSFAQTDRFEVMKSSNTSNSKKNENVGNLSKKLNYNFLKDYESMSIEVRNKINANKINSKKLSEGILKSYTVNVKSCISIETTRKTFTFLESKSGIVETKFISKGIIQIVVIPEYDSESLKEALSSNEISFKFLSENYFLLKR